MRPVMRYDQFLGPKAGPQDRLVLQGEAICAGNNHEQPGHEFLAFPRSTSRRLGFVHVDLFLLARGKD
jgi:hypothetical protein